MLYLKVTFDPEREGRFAPVEIAMGTDILDALREAEALGKRLECGVQFCFNDQLAWITPGMDPETQWRFLLETWGWAPRHATKGNHDGNSR
jgi:hypothetical protein